MNKYNIDELMTRSLAEIPEREITFLSFPFLPRGAIAIFAGEGGCSKSTMWCSIAADISAGRAPIISKASDNPPEDLKPEKVLFFSTEDSIDTVIKRRLRLHGANFDNIIGFDCGDALTGDIRFDGDQLQLIIANYRPALCIFDPLQSFLDPRIQMGARNAMRQALTPLLSLGEKYGTTFLIIAHSNKSHGTWGRSRLADSADLWDISRSVVMFGTVKNDIRYMSHEKANYSKQGKSIEFAIVDEKVSFIQTTEKSDSEYVLARSFNDREKDQAKDTRLAAKTMILEKLSVAPNQTLLESDLKRIVVDTAKLGLRAYKDAKRELKEERVIRIFPKGYQGPFCCKLTTDSVKALSQSSTPD